MESALTDGSRVTAIVETEAVRARDEILAIVTHDLRTPLSAIATAASLLTSIDALNPDPDRIRKRGETIQRAARHMLRLVTDLSDLAQIDSGRLAIVRTLDDATSRTGSSKLTADACGSRARLGRAAHSSSAFLVDLQLAVTSAFGILARVECPSTSLATRCPTPPRRTAW